MAASGQAPVRPGRRARFSMRALWLKLWTKAVSLGTKDWRWTRGFRARSNRLAWRSQALERKPRKPYLPADDAPRLRSIRWERQLTRNGMNTPSGPPSPASPLSPSLRVRRATPAPSPTGSGCGRPVWASCIPGFTTPATGTTASPAIMSTGLRPSVSVRNVGGRFMTNSTERRTETAVTPSRSRFWSACRGLAYPCWR